jgi:hypothetical protein
MKVLVIACRVLINELKAVCPPGIQLEFLEQGLHNTPDKMRVVIQEKIHEVDSSYDYIMLGYGACGNGTLGIKAENVPVIIPKAHDCITFWMGSVANHMGEHKKAPGTYYLSKGWIEEAKSPMERFAEYKERYGAETAEWVMKEAYKNYTRIALIATGSYDPVEYREHAKANATFLGVNYEELEGSMSIFEKMMRNEWDTDDFIILQPGEEVTQDMFLSLS